MRNEAARKRLSRIPKETRIFVSKYADLLVLINQILEEREISQARLAEMMEKQPSEICKWLKGEHNFTLRSICKLEAELGETLIEIPSRKRLSGFSGGISSEVKIIPIGSYKGVQNWEIPQINHNSLKSNVG